MMGERISKLSVIDTNDTLVPVKSGYQPHYITKSPDQDFLLRTKEVLGNPLKPLKPIESFKQILSSIYAAQTNDTPLDVQNKLREWTFLDARTPLNPAVEGQQPHDEYFDNYESLADKDVEGIRKLKDEGVGIIICSGMPYLEERSRLRKELDRCWEYLYPEASAILNPDLNNISSIHIKILTLAVFGKPRIEGVEYPNAGLVSVYPFDDDFAIALWLAHVLGIRVYLKVDETTARNQLHLTKIDLPPKDSTYGEVVFGATLERILADAKNPKFVNIPMMH